MPPQIAGWSFHFDDVRAEVRENHRGAWPGDEAREVYHLQTGEDLVRRVFCRHETLYLLPECVSWDGQAHRPWKWAERFSRNARVPSFSSSVPAQSPKSDASSDKPSLWLVSNPLFA